MKNNKPILLIIGVLLVLGVLFSLLWGGGSHDWRETYDEDKKDPYGLFVMLSLLEDYFPEQEVIVLKDSLRNMLTAENDANYVFVGGGMYLTEEDTEELLDFVERGNNAFLISRSLPADLTFYMFDTTCYDIWWEDYYAIYDTIVNLNFTHPNLKVDTTFSFKHLQKQREVPYRHWYYIDSDYFCEEEFSPAKLGDFSDTLINFARFEYGEGAFYLHTMPSIFTNINLLEENGLNYADRVFSHLSEGNIYWDAYSRVPESVARRMNDNNYSPNRGLSEENPLQYVLSQPPLALAWYITLVMGLLYLVFRAKRRQRMIPVIEQNKNTSLAFITTIGRMYFLQNNHRKLVLQKMQLFLGDVRERYKISTHDLDESFMKRLSERSEVDIELIHKIIIMHDNIQHSTGASENTLIEFHQITERFWKEGK